MKPNNFRFPSLLALSVAIAACVPQAAPPPPVAAPSPAPTPTSAPAPAPVVLETAYENWLDAPQTSGDWSYRKDGTMTLAGFGPPETEYLFVLQCQPGAKAIRLLIAGESEAEQQAVVRTETRTQMLTLRQSDMELPYLEARLSAFDPLLDAMAVTKGRFAIEAEGMPTLYLPSWAEVTRVIEDCR